MRAKKSIGITRMTAMTAMTAMTTAALAALGTGCGNDDGGPVEGALVWSACGPLVEGGRAGECAVMRAPLDWNAAAESGEAGGETVDVFVKRFRGEGSGRGQLWFLDGGPGGSGAQFDNAELVAALDQLGWDLYLPAHRGTGKSTPLTCAAAVAEDSEEGARMTLGEAASCAPAVAGEWGARLAHFSAEQAARDLGELIARAQGTGGKRPESGQRVAIWGGSYGTYWAQRYLQAFPAQADAVVLEGALDLTDRLSDQLRSAEAAGERFLTACGADAFCRAQLGGDPGAAYDAATAKIAAGSCAPLAELTVPAWKQIARSLVDAQLGYDARAILAAMIQRIARCGAGDAPVLERFVAGLPAIAQELEGDETDPATNNYLLALNEARIDLWAPGLDRAAEMAAHDALRFSSGEEWAESAEALAGWPALPRAAAADVPAVTQTPILVLTGGLDTATPSQWAAKAAARYPTAREVVFSYGGHGVSFDEVTGECALGIWLGFLADPEAALERDCADEVRPIDFRGGGARDLSRQWLGTENPWR